MDTTRNYYMIDGKKHIIQYGQCGHRFFRPVFFLRQKMQMATDICINKMLCTFSGKIFNFLLQLMILLQFIDLLAETEKETKLFIIYPQFITRNWKLPKN